MPKIIIELTNDELEDLLEMVRLHPEKFPNTEVALKSLGLKRYRELKQTYDPQRKRPMAVLSLFEESEEYIPCVLNDIMEKSEEPITAGGMTYFPGFTEEHIKGYRELCESFKQRGEVPPSLSQIIKWGIDFLK